MTLPAVSWQLVVIRTRAGDRPRYSAPTPLEATMLRPVPQNCATVARPSAGLPRVSMTVLMHSRGMETSTDAAPAVAPVTLAGDLVSPGDSTYSPASACPHN